MTEERTWVADPTLPWNILLHASLPHPPDTALLEERLAAMSRHAGWPGVPPAPREEEDLLGLLRSLADDPDGSFPVAVGVHGRGVVVRAHHAALDGLGLVAALGWLLGVPVSSTAKGIGADRPAQPFLRGVMRRLGEVAFRPPAVVRSTTVRPGPGDAFASLTVPGRLGTADLVRAASAALAPRTDSPTRIVVGVGLSRTGGASPSLADDSAFLRLGNVAGRSTAEVRELMTSAPVQVAASGSSGGPLAGPMRTGMRLLAGRLGSTVLVSHLGGLSVPGVAGLAFYPVTGGGSGLSLGAAGLGDATTLTLRARARQHDADGLQEILEAVRGCL